MEDRRRTGKNHGSPFLFVWGELEFVLFIYMNGANDTEFGKSFDEFTVIRYV